jgi:hypothetical protein
MADIVSWESAIKPAVTGGVPSAKGDIVDWNTAIGATEKPGMIERAADTVLRALGVTSFRAQDLGEAVKESVRGPVLAKSEVVGKRAEKAGRYLTGSAAQVADMPVQAIASVPRTVGFFTMMPVLQALGADAKTAATGAKILTENIPEEIASPWASTAKSLGLEKQYNDNPVGWILHGLSEFVSKGASKAEKSTGIPSEVLEQLADTTMGALGIKAIKGAVKGRADFKAAEQLKADKAVAAAAEKAAAEKVAWVEEEMNARRAESTMQARLTNTPSKMRQEAEAKFTQEMKMQEAALKDMQPDVRAIIAEVKKTPAPTPKDAGVAWVEDLFQKAKEGKLEEPAPKVDSAKPLTPLERAQAADAIKLPSTNELYVQRLAERASKGETLLPNEASILRTVGEQSGIVKAGKSTGKIDPELLTVLAGGATGLAVGLPLLQAAWNHYNPDQQISLKALANGASLWVKQAGPGEQDRNLTPKRKIPEVVDPGMVKEPGDTPPWMQYRKPEAGREVMAEASDLLPAVAGVAAAGMLKGKLPILDKIPAAAKESLPILKGEQGNIDPRLAAVGGGAAIGLAINSYFEKDAPLHNMLMGAGLAALVAFPKGQELLKDGLQFADKTLGEISTRVRNISEELLRPMRAQEQQWMEGTHRDLERVDPFLNRLNAKEIPAEVKGELDSALMRNDLREVDRIAKIIGPEARAEWQAVRDVLEQKGEQLQQYSYLTKLRTDYFPLAVKDVEGLLSAVGKESRTRLEDKLAAAEKKSFKTAGRGLNELERSLIVNQELRSSAPTSGRAGFQRQRGIEMSKELEQYYYSPTESLHSYLRQVNAEIAKADFFGRDAQMVKTGGVSYLDLDASIGSKVSGLLKAGEITQGEMAELSSMIRSRFTGGEQGASRWVQVAKNVGYTGTIGNVLSAVAQVQDALMAPFHADVRGAVSSIAQQITGRQQTTAKSYGMVDHLSEEFVNTSSSAKALNSIFKISGFTAIDLFGKDMVLNSYLNKYQRMAKTESGQMKLAQEWGDYFTGDLAQLVQDFGSGKVTPLVREALFSKLSDIQPISKLEVPQTYLDNPNGRALYMLKSFALKQADIARVQGYNQIKKGVEQHNPALVGKGMAFLAGYATFLGVSGASMDIIKDWMLGRPFDARWKDIPLNMIKTFGWTEYTMDMVAKGEPLKAVTNIAMPPFQILDTIVKNDPKALNYLPFIGKMVYPHTDTGELTEAKRLQKRQREEDSEYQAKKAERALLKKERMKDPEWRDYYLRRAQGENPARPR